MRACSNNILSANKGADKLPSKLEMCINIILLHYLKGVAALKSLQLS